MGEVYRARDSRLGRDVAVKVLPAEMAGNAELMARFEREAQLLASLNHTNIATIYGLEESGATRALVMELVEGPTLADRIAQGPIPLAEALPTAQQIAEALEYAHEKGIIHRDLKPANVKVTPEGKVKVLDFGLAKALATEPSASAMTNSPTTFAATRAGVILGTAAYMAPEQAKGKTVDRRADIWAFGCVLFEMLTAQQAFEGETVSDVLAAVIMKDPDWGALPASTPESIRKLLRRCLEKDSKRRLRDIGEARIAIEESVAPASPPAGSAAMGTSPLQGSAMRTSPLQQPLWRRALPWAAAILLVTTISLAFLLFRELSVPVRPIHAYILPPDKTSFALEAEVGTPALSPDGRRLVFSARNSSAVEMLWVRPLDSMSAQPLEGTEGASFPFWSPDSRYVAYFASGKLMKIDAFGGPVQTICDAPNGRGGTWGAGGTIVFAPLTTSGLEQVSAAGGSPTAIGQIDKSRPITSRWPVFLPDGRHFIYWAGNPFAEASQGGNGIYLGSLDGKDPKFLAPAESDALYAPSGYLLFLKGATLVAQPFDTRRLELTGEALPLAEHVTNPLNYRLGQFSVSQDGDLVYHSGSLAPDQVVWTDASGKQLGLVGEPALIWELRLSPDGKTLVETVGDVHSKNTDLWLVDLVRGVRTRFTFVSATHAYPIWSPDGEKIAFAASHGGSFDIFVESANGSGTAQPLLEDNTVKRVKDWSRDGRYIAYDRASLHGETGWDMWVLPLFGDKKPFPFLQSQFNESSPAFSPDGKWLAYDCNESGRTEVYVTPFPEGGGKRQVSTSGGWGPRWRQDGKELFFVSADNKLTAAAIQEKGPSLEIGNPQVLFQMNLATSIGLSPFDVSPDGKKFVVLTQPAHSSAEPITLVTNWTALLRNK
jgi:Tol biopolymer transport system component